MGSEINPQNLQSGKSLPLEVPLSQISSAPQNNSKTPAWELKFATSLKIKTHGHNRRHWVHWLQNNAFPSRPQTICARACYHLFSPFLIYSDLFLMIPFHQCPIYFLSDTVSFFTIFASASEHCPTCVFRLLQLKQNTIIIQELLEKQ